MTMGEEGLQSHHGQGPATAAGPAAGQRFGHYALTTRLGSGTLADVWLAVDVRTQREVALKLLVRGDPQDRTRLIAEAQAATELSHPGIVPVYEIGRANGTDFIASEYVPGVSLANTGVSFEDAARLVAETAVAIQYAHQRDVVHGDLKPANILVDADRNARVTDFGIARTVRIGKETVFGTPAYLAPELVQPKGRPTLSERTDIYALGATLYELAVGDPPYEGPADGDVLRQIRAGPPPAPRSANPRVPHDLGAVILKAMARTPSRRYADAAALADDLRRWLDHVPVASGRRRLLLWVGAATGVVMLAVVAFLVWPGGGAAADEAAPPPPAAAAGILDRMRTLVERAEEGRARGERIEASDRFREVSRILEGLPPDGRASAEARLLGARAMSGLAALQGAFDDRALEEVETVLRKEPAHAGAKTLRARLVADRGLSRRRKGDLRAAREDLREALRSGHEPDRVRFEMAAIDDALGEDDAALSVYEELRSRSKDSALVRWADSAAGWIFLARGDGGRAYERLLAAAKSRGPDGRFWLWLATQATSEETWDRARDVARAWIEAMPKEPEAHVNLAAALSKLGDPESGLAALDRAKEGGVEPAKLRRWRAEILDRMGRTEEALGELAEVLKGEPMDGEARFARVRLLLKLKQWTGAEQEAVELLNALPEKAATDRALTRIFLAESQAGQGAMKDAATFLKDALERTAVAPSDLADRPGLETLLKDPEVAPLIERNAKRWEAELERHRARAFLGVQMTQAPGDASGVLVTSTVRGSAARSAGIRPGDQIVEFEGQAVASYTRLSELIGARKVGETVRLKVERGEEESFPFEVRATLGARPEGK